MESEIRNGREENSQNSNCNKLEIKYEDEENDGLINNRIIPQTLKNPRINRENAINFKKNLLAPLPRLGSKLNLFDPISETKRNLRQVV